ncbi:hypothetical protein Bbelb_205640 [Branchiostoma belcheri]|nr:hypothetical protein Bbelb_205640 [Branchiostoma belcheri]
MEDTPEKSNVIPVIVRVMGTSRLRRSPRAYGARLSTLHNPGYGHVTSIHRSPSDLRAIDSRSRQQTVVNAILQSRLMDSIPVGRDVEFQAQYVTAASITRATDAKMSEISSVVWDPVLTTRVLEHIRTEHVFPFPFESLLVSRF